MEMKDFKQHVEDLSCFDAAEVEEMRFATDEELVTLQRELEENSGVYSNWELMRAVITYRKKIWDLEQPKELAGEKISKLVYDWAGRKQLDPKDFRELSVGDLTTMMSKDKKEQVSKL